MTSDTVSTSGIEPSMMPPYEASVIRSMDLRKVPWPTSTCQCATITGWTL